MKFTTTHAVEQLGFSETTSRPNWKPFVFSPLYIVPVSLLHLLAIVGIQLLIKEHDKHEEDIALAQSNRTLSETPSSFFVFEESDTITFMLWAYIPVAIAVILSLGWEALDVKVRRLEPFRQLASPEGGTADNALCLDYTTLFGLLTPFFALKRRHYTVALSSTMHIIASIALPAVASGIFNIGWGSLSFSAGRREGKDFAAISVNRDFAVANQVFHGLLLAGGLALSARLFTRRSGLYHDPNTIGGLTAILSDSARNGSTAIRLFRQIPSFAHSAVVKKALGNIVFRLEHIQVLHTDGSSSSKYQLTTDVAPHTVIPIMPEERCFYRNRKDATGYWLMRRSAWSAEAFLWFGQAAIGGAIYAVAKLVGENEEVSKSRPMIFKLVLTIFITIGGMMWTSIQRDIQLFAPWRSLSKPPELALANAIWRYDPVGRGQYGAAAFGLTRGFFAILWASVCVSLVHAITIFIPPILELAWVSGVSGGHARYREIGVLTGKSGLALGGSGVALHCIFFINLVIYSFSHISNPFLPRAPTTVASQILYLCRSERLLQRFEGASTLSSKALAEELKRAQGKCLFGWFWWREGGAWCVGIEEYERGAPWHPFDFGKEVVGGPQYS